MIILLQSVTIQFRRPFCIFRNAKCNKLIQLGITKCDRLLLEKASGFYNIVRRVLQSVTDCYYKVRQALQSVTGFVTKCVRYYKV